jgi:FlaA1/EpsC-like NDP-sugar epimerase
MPRAPVATNTLEARPVMQSRLFNRTAQLFIDAGVLAVAYILAYLLRFEGAIPAIMLRTLAWTLPYVVALNYGSMMAFGVHRLAWRYIGLRDMRRIALAVATGTSLLLVSRLATSQWVHQSDLWARAIIPLGVTLSNAAFTFLGIVGVRVARRMLAERDETSSRVRQENEPVRTMLIGAGRAGVLVAKEMASRPDLGLVPVGFLDDDPVKVGTVMHGIPVLGTTSELARLCANNGATQALITIATASGSSIRRITKLCEEADVPVKIIPGLFEIVGGTVNLSRIREVAIEDLLGREPVQLDEDAINRVVKGRTVLVTGAGGSIGSELCRQIGRFEPAALMLVEHSENSLFFIERELRALFPALDLKVHLADIREKSRIDSILTRQRPDVIFHAAAHKHVPMMEANPTEAIKNNVLGTKALAELADAHGVGAFVMISTDKAVNPTSVMGASKRAAEIFVQALSQRSKTRFVAVRFGNVLGSAGSVVPIFKEQIARGGPVTITDPEMKRYFMTIPEACQLVLQAGAMGKGGEIFVLDMGEPVKIMDLARDLIALSGLRVGDDIEIQVTGTRPGEKLFEELSLAEEGAERTGHPKVFIGRIKPHPWESVLEFIAELESVTQAVDAAVVRGVFQRFVTEYRPNLGRPPSSVPRVPLAKPPSGASSASSSDHAPVPPASVGSLRVSQA